MRNHSPHFYYYYTIGNVGEGMMAKNAARTPTTISYLTPPFTESKTRDEYKEADEQNRKRTTRKTTRSPPVRHRSPTKKIAPAKMGLHRDLRLDNLLTQPLFRRGSPASKTSTPREMRQRRKMTGQLYTTGVPYSPEDPFVGNGHERRRRIQRGGPRPPARKINRHAALKSQAFFTQHYLKAGRATGSPGARRQTSR